jgi:HK97 family phage prohead protease
MADLERRSVAAAAVPILSSGEARSKSAVTVSGIALEWGALSEDIGFRETFHRDAFRDQERDTKFSDVTVDLAHESVLLLGSVGAGTARIEATRDHLKYVVDIPNSLPYVSELVQRGDLGHASVAFRALEDQWVREGDIAVRMVTRAQLYAVTLCNSPAYPQTTAQVVNGASESPSGRSRESVELEAKIRRRLVEAHRFTAAQIMKPLPPVESRRLEAKIRRRIIDGHRFQAERLRSLNAEL